MDINFFRPSLFRCVHSLAVPMTIAATVRMHEATPLLSALPWNLILRGTTVCQCIPVAVKI